MSALKKKVIYIPIFVLLFIFAFTNFTNRANESKHTPLITAKSDYNDVASISFVVNKRRPLPDGYTPNDLDGILRKEPKEKLEALLLEARSQSIDLRIISGYRSQSSQASLYSTYFAKDGQELADTYSARPRYSEHQTGLAVDLGNSDNTCDLDICFSDTPGGKWLSQNSYKFGFIIRYQKDKTNITGYQFEPWHLRYVGIPIAKELHSSNKTLEEYFGLPAAPSY